MAYQDRPADRVQDAARRMTADRWSRLQALFEEALTLAQPAQSAFLARCRAVDAGLADEVEALVRSSDEADSFIDEAIARAWARAD